ncbi:hypothetical protein NPIL_192431 [Nephila pilipes]|uniref:Uncharacterized protein n=1 Tax=Nephila pilipes TaxID=299642 RepID=A0A8X6N6P2_NEPPI|nr:hypothetical protein NPIL_192431 [Nephila pilipes]
MLSQRENSDDLVHCSRIISRMLLNSNGFDGKIPTSMRVRSQEVCLTAGRPQIDLAPTVRRTFSPSDEARDLLRRPSKATKKGLIRILICHRYP